MVTEIEEMNGLSEMGISFTKANLATVISLPAEETKPYLKYYTLAWTDKSGT